MILTDRCMYEIVTQQLAKTLDQEVILLREVPIQLNNFQSSMILAILWRYNCCHKPPDAPPIRLGIRDDLRTSDIARRKVFNMRFSLF